MTNLIRKKADSLCLTPFPKLVQTLHSLHYYQRDRFRRQISSPCSKSFNDSPLLSGYTKISSIQHGLRGMACVARPQFFSFTSLHIPLCFGYCYSLDTFQVPEHDEVLPAARLLGSSSLVWRVSIVPSHHPCSPSCYFVVTFSGSAVRLLHSSHAVCIC